MVGDILQPTHLLFLLIVALIVLGPKRLPEVARTLGDGIRDFRNAISGERDSDISPRDDADEPGGHDPYIERANDDAPVEPPHTDNGAPVEEPHPSAVEAPESNGAEPAHAAPPPKPAEPPRA
ncbi:MAG: Sec-independent protein translocase subunit TatA/TatB [Solirubrobacteraceae bacterium]